MPQMSPLNWLSLYVIFTITLIMFCVVNYYCYIPLSHQKETSEKKTTQTLNWKW